MNKTLGQDMRDLLNRHSAENSSDTPDFILALFLGRCLEAWNEAVQEREKWYGRYEDIKNRPTCVSCGRNEDRCVGC